MQSHGRDALFIGDGANDTLAAQSALCSGTLAVERTLLAEQSDFYFLSRSLSPLRLLFNVAAHRRLAVQRAFAFAITYNIGVLVLALLGHMNPLLAAILMPLSSVFTILIVRAAMPVTIGVGAKPQNSAPPVDPFVLMERQRVG